MAVTFRTTQTATKNTSSTSLVITKPVGLASGDIMVAFINSDASTIATPSGWTTIGSEFAYHSTDRYMKAFYKKADSGDAAATNFTFTYASAGRVAGVLAAYTGAGILDVTNQGAVASGASSSSGVTPSAGNTADMFIIMVSGAGSGSETGPSTGSYAMVTNNPSWTELADTSTNVGGGGGINASMAWASRAQVTATGNVTATVSPASESIIGSGLIIAAMTESRSVAMSSGQLLLTGGANAVKVGVKIALTGAQLLLTGGSNSASKTLVWANQSRNNSSWTNQSKSDV